MMEQRFPRSQRLLTNKDFRAVFNAKATKAAVNGAFVLAKRNELAVARLGIVVAKRQIAKAVQRNRIKRLIRESFRQHKHVFQGLDLVVIVQKKCLQYNNIQFYNQLERLWERLIKRLGN